MMRSTILSLFPMCQCFVEEIIDQLQFTKTRIRGDKRLQTSKSLVRVILN